MSRRCVPEGGKKAQPSTGASGIVAKSLVPQSLLSTAIIEHVKTPSGATTFILPSDMTAVIGFR
jgi:hypothetical protein